MSDLAGDEEPRSASPLRPAAALTVSVDVLRQKLDAAIVAEAWEAVKAIGERIVELQREEAGVSLLSDERAKRRR